MVLNKLLKFIEYNLLGGIKHMRLDIAYQYAMLLSVWFLLFSYMYFQTGVRQCYYFTFLSVFVLCFYEITAIYLIKYQKLAKYFEIFVTSLIITYFFVIYLN